MGAAALVLAQRQANNEAVQLVADFNLATQATILRDFFGESKHRLFRTFSDSTCLIDPAGINIDMTRCACAAAATVTVDAR